VLSLCLAAAAQQGRSFSLRNTRTQEQHGPFVYQDMGQIAIGAAVYQIRVTRTGRAFTVSTPAADKVFGPFQFVPGRIIVVDGAALEITSGGAAAPTAPTSVPPLGTPEETLPPDTMMQLPPLTDADAPVIDAPPPIDYNEPRPLETFAPAGGVEAGIVWEPYVETDYDQGIRGASTTYDLSVDRHILSGYLKRSGFSVGLGYVANASWSGILLAAATADVADAGIEDGTGYAASLRYEHTVYSSGKWDVDLFGDLSFIHEEYDVGFVTEEGSMDVSIATNGVVVTNTVSTKSDPMADSLELNETTARLGATAVYVAAPWRAYAGASVVLFDDVDISTSVHVGEGNTRVTLDRVGMVSGFLGGSVDYYGYRGFAEYMYGDASGFRLGVSRRF